MAQKRLVPCCGTWYTIFVSIQSIIGKRTEQAVQGKFKGYPADLVKRTKAMLIVLNTAKELSDLRSPPGNMLETLKGDRKGQHSVRINKQWRICFEWTPQGPANVEIADYH